MEQIRMALEMYKSVHGYYPNENSSGPWGGDWEISWEDGGAFIEVLQAEGYFSNGTPLDPVNNSSKCYYYYRYPGGGDCPITSGDYYVLGIVDMEAGNRPYPGSPGWSCNPAVRDWQNEFDWVTGSFTN